MTNFEFLFLLLQILRLYVVHAYNFFPAISIQKDL
jgi:hypothetical protein